MGKRMEREQKTVETMIRLYCVDHHGGSGELCADCEALRAYASERLDRCAFQDDKPPCSKCPVHCYRTSMREKIQEVMRYAGPRMLTRHPVQAVRHLVDERKKPGPTVEEAARRKKTE